MIELSIGTVQFGLDYGISNTQGQTSSEEASRILNFAKTENIYLLTLLKFMEPQKRFWVILV